MAYRKPTERHITPGIPKPGYFPLHLKIASGIEEKQINYLLGENDLELRSAPSYVHIAIKNFKAVLMFSKPVFHGQAISDLEQVYQKNPKNINTLENLIYMCETTKPTRDTKDYKEKLKEAKKDQIEEARCLLEQGYALITDTHSEATGNIPKKVKELKCILQQKECSTTGITVGQIGQARQFLTQFEQRMQAIPDICVEDTKKQRQWSIKCFESGLSKLENLQLDPALNVDKKEVLVWKHFLGKAYNRVGGSCMAFSKTREKKSDLRRAMELFCDVIQGLSEENPEPKLQICVARSYGYLGHLIITKKKIVVKVKEEIPQCMRQNEFEDVWENPAKALEKAEKLADKDRVVLNRIGLALQKGENCDLSRAEEKYNISIKECYEFNWFAYSCRGSLYLEMYSDQVRRYEKEMKSRRQQNTSRDDPKRPDKTLLKKAENDLEQCLTCKTTTHVLYNLANVNYYQGTDPSKVKAMRDHVVDSTKINMAVLKLQESLEYHECDFHSRIYALLGKCLFSLGDRKNGIKYMKTAIFLEHPNVKDPVDFENLCRFLLQTYQTEKNETYAKRINLLSELWVMLHEAARKYKKRLNYQLVGVTNSFPHEILDLLQEVERGKIRYSSKDSKQVIDTCIGALKKHNGERVKKRANGLAVQELMPSDGDAEPEVVEVAPAPEQAMFTKRYDFYISHSKEMTPWVEVCLLPILEGHYQLKGCFKKRDFDRSKTDEENVDIILHEARKVIVIVTECYKTSCMNELYKLVRYSHPDHPGHPDGDNVAERKDNFIIPILRDVEDPPEILNFIESLDFSGQTYDIQRLYWSLCEEYSCHSENEMSKSESEIEGTGSTEATNADETYSEIKNDKKVHLPTDNLNDCKQPENSNFKDLTENSTKQQTQENKYDEPCQTPSSISNNCEQPNSSKLKDLAENPIKHKEQQPEIQNDKLCQSSTGITTEPSSSDFKDINENPVKQQHHQQQQPLNDIPV